MVVRILIVIIAWAMLAPFALAADHSHASDTVWRQQVLKAESVALASASSRSTEHTRSGEGIANAINLLRVSLRVPTSQGTIAARLWLTPRCLLQRDRRLITMIPGSLSNGAGYYEVEVAGFEGFNAVSVLARAGYCTLTIDLPGSGDSDHPSNAMDLRAVDNATAVAQVARPVALLLGVRRWDVYTETGAPTPVALLLARRADVRSLVVSSPFYKRFGPGSGAAFDPGFRAFVASTPYFPIDAAFIGAFFGTSPAPVQSAAIDAILGPVPHAVPTGTAFNEIAEVPFDLDPLTGEFVLSFPIVDAGPALADALLLQGSPDFVGSEAGTAELAERYGASGGGNVETVLIADASHLMRFDATFGNGPASAVWAPILDFLASH